MRFWIWYEQRKYGEKFEASVAKIERFCFRRQEAVFYVQTRGCSRQRRGGCDNAAFAVPDLPASKKMSSGNSAPLNTAMVR